MPVTVEPSVVKHTFTFCCTRCRVPIAEAYIEAPGPLRVARSTALQPIYCVDCAALVRDVQP